MEKKNTILLTVIAIATLLVAVVGATFAYFTAQVSTAENDNATTNVKTYTLATAEMDRGKDVSSEGVYPGTTIVKPLVIKGACADEKGCQDINTVIEVSATIDPAFGTDVTWKLYKGKTTNPTGEGATAITNEITCTPENITNGGKYYANPGCSVNGTAVDKITGYDAIISGSATTDTPVTTPVKVSSETNDTYYLVVEYTNHMDTLDANNDIIPGAQNEQQGKSFSVTVNYRPAA